MFYVCFVFHHKSRKTQTKCQNIEWSELKVWNQPYSLDQVKWPPFLRKEKKIHKVQFQGFRRNNCIWWTLNLTLNKGLFRRMGWQQLVSENNWFSPRECEKCDNRCNILWNVNTFRKLISPINMDVRFQKFSKIGKIMSVKHAKEAR